MEEDRAAQDARVEKLWRALDTNKQGHLDLEALKKGLVTINHPLKNADELLQDVLNAVDTNKDGRIQYSEFRTFVEQTEGELWRLFKGIDRDHNGQLDKSELMAAFQTAGIRLPTAKLDQFFSEVDTNHDGVITFDEWRNFLLFIPANTPSLRAILSYYSSTVTVNPEGDVHVSNETVEGLGNHQFHRQLFGGLFKVMKTEPLHGSVLEPLPARPDRIDAIQDESRCDTAVFAWDPGDKVFEHDAMPEQFLAEPYAIEPAIIPLLTDMFPAPGYFFAGGIAGAVSRTATAPLDRLKVYLIAQVGVTEDAVQAAKSGAPVKAAKTATLSLAEACKALWRMGGMHSLFAGNGLNVIKVIPESAIKFGSYEAAKRAMARFEGHDDSKALNPWSQFFAAGLGGMISQAAIYPIDTLKFRMQNETVKGGPHGNALIAATARKMWKQGGILACYRGLGLGLLGMFPYSAIDLTTFEYLKRFAVRRKAKHLNLDEDDVNLGNFTTAGIGAFSGAFGASVVYPINLLRTRLQSQGTKIHPPVYNGVWDVTARTIKGEGWRGLFKGLTPNLLKVVPAVSITYVVYENSKRIMNLA